MVTPTYPHDPNARYPPLTRITEGARLETFPTRDAGAASRLRCESTRVPGACRCGADDGSHPKPPSDGTVGGERQQFTGREGVRQNQNPT